MDQPSIEIAQLPAQFAALLARTQPGGSIIITEGGQPRALLTPLAEPDVGQPTTGEGQPTTTPTDEVEVTVWFAGEPKTVRMPVSPPSDRDRVPGLGRGKITVLPGFDDPLPEEFWLGES